MKYYFCFLFLLLIFCHHSFSQIESSNPIKDGLYLVINTGTDTTSFDSLTRNQLVIKLNELFIEDNEDAHIRFLIDTTEYVPLELDKAPVSEAQTEQKKKLMLSLTPSASEILKNFSSRHVMQKVVIVVNGEALTMHKVREPITSGQLQITRCTDNACEKLYIMMKDNIKK